MMRRGLITGMAILTLVGCSSSNDEALLAWQAEYESRLETLDMQLLEATEASEKRWEQSGNGIRKMSVEYREHYDEFFSQLAAMRVVVDEFTEQQGKQDLLIASLKEEVDRLEAQLTRLQAVRTTQSSPAPRRPAPTKPVATPKPAAPAFDVTGIEVRGGRPFVAVASHSAQSLNEVRLLEVGEAFSGWRVSRVGERTAEFISGTGSVELTVQ